VGVKASCERKVRQSKVKWLGRVTGGAGFSTALRCTELFTSLCTKYEVIFLEWHFGQGMSFFRTNA